MTAGSSSSSPTRGAHLPRIMLLRANDSPDSRLGVRSGQISVLFGMRRTFGADLWCLCIPVDPSMDLVHCRILLAHAHRLVLVAVIKKLHLGTTEVGIKSPGQTLTLLSTLYAGRYPRS